MKLIIILTSLLACFFSVTSYGGESISFRLNAENLDQYRTRGTDATAGVGDWFLSNGNICIAVSDKDHDTGTMGKGGVLIDINHCGRSDDQWTFNHFLPNLDQYHTLRATSISAKKSGGKAAIEVVAQADGIQVITTYSLANDATELNIEYVVSRFGEGEAVSLLGAITMHVHRALTPFVLSTSNLAASRGFIHKDFDSSDMLSAVEAMTPADLIVYEGAPNLSPSVSYGLQLSAATLITAGGENIPLPKFSQAHADYSIHGVMTETPWLGGGGKLGLLEFAQSQFMDINVGDKVVMQQKLWISDSGDIAGITDQIYNGVTLSGSVDVGQARLMISSLDGFPITNVMSDANGAYSARLPKGLDAVQIEAATQWQQLPPKVVAITNQDVVVDKIITAKPSFITVRSSEPVRLIFKGINGTSDPQFNDDLIDFSLSDILIASNLAVNYISLSGKESMAQEYPLLAGDYEVYATRGLEYGVVKTPLTVEEGKDVNFIAPVPKREVNSDGWLSSDFHVHSAPSFDTKISKRQRLKSFVAQGGDVMIGSEHNMIAAYDDDIAAEQLADNLVVVAGTELTSLTRTENTPFSFGHANVFPMKVQEDQFSGGLLSYEGKRIRTLIKQYNTNSDQVIFQMNHPRKTGEKEDDSYYLDHLAQGSKYDPSLPLDSETNRSLIEADEKTGLRDIDIDLIEIANGSYMEPFFANYETIRQDWFSFLQQGELIFASANSDSHGNVELVAMPRNYVYVGDDNIATFDQEKFISAISKGRLYGSSGPLVTVSANTAAGEINQAMGATLTGDELTLNINIQSATWVPADTMNVYVNGALQQVKAIKANDKQAIKFKFDKDSFVVIEVVGEASELYNIIAPTLRPFAFTNPIFIDANNDGNWDAPGLPE